MVFAMPFTNQRSHMKIKITQVEAIKATRYHMDPDAVLHGAA